MAIGITHLDENVNTTNNPTIASNSISPTANSLLVVIVAFNDSGANGFSSIADTLTGTGTWTQQDFVISGTLTGISIYTAQAGSSPGSGTITATLTTDASRKLIHVYEITGFDTSTPVAQTKTNSGTTSTTITLTLDSTPQSDSVVVGAVASTVLTTDNLISDTTGNYTEGAESNAGAAGGGGANLQSEYDNGGATDTLSWSGLGTTRDVCVAIEVSALATGDLSVNNSYVTTHIENITLPNDTLVVNNSSVITTSDDVNIIEKTEKIIDNFNDNSTDTSKWNVSAFSNYNAGVTVSETNNRLEITTLNDPGLAYNGYISVNEFDLTDSYCLVEVPQVATGSPTDTMLRLWESSGNVIGFTHEDGVLYLERYVGGSSTGSSSVAYNSTDHRWWRIRHSSVGDLIYFDTSADGVSWTNRHSLSRSGLDITNMRVGLEAGTWNSATSTTAYFDNLNGPLDASVDNTYVQPTLNNVTLEAGSATELVVSGLYCETIAGNIVVVQNTLTYLRPNADVTDGFWTDFLGSNVDLYSNIDEAVVSDVDGIQSEWNPSSSPVVFKLQAGSDPLVSHSHVLYVRYDKDPDTSESVNFLVQLRQDYISEVSQGTLIAEWTLSDIGGTLVVLTGELTPSEIDSITNYSTLHVRMVAG